MGGRAGRGGDQVLAFGRLFRSRSEEAYAALLLAHAAENPASLAAAAHSARRELLAFPADLVAAATSRARSGGVTDIAAALADGDLPAIG